MKALDVLEYAFADFTSNKFKTMMSSLGIIIGVMAIVVMLTLGDGLYAGVSQQFGDLELDTMVVLPMSFNMNTGEVDQSKPPAKFTDRDVNLVMGTSGVKEVYPSINVGAQGTYKDDNRSVQVSAVIPQYEKRYAAMIDKGRYLSNSDKYVVVLGSKVANGTFSKKIKTGDYITLTNPYTQKSQDYAVVGIMQERNGSILAGDPNSAVYMTRAGLKGISDQSSFSYIAVRSDSIENADQTAKNVENSLKRLHRNEGFIVLTQKMFADAINQIFNLIKYTLAGIGAVSLLVGGIGITNVMMLTVKERVKEIGLMKAVGATTANVRIIFLTESALLGLISGLIGVGIAWGVAAIVGNLAGLSMNVSWTNIAIGIAFGLFTTTIAGVYPANQASKLDPIEALRTE